MGVVSLAAEGEVADLLVAVFRGRIVEGCTCSAELRLRSKV